MHLASPINVTTGRQKKECLAGQRLILETLCVHVCVCVVVVLVVLVGVLFNENICHGVVTFVNLFPSFTLLAPGATLFPQNAHEKRSDVHAYFCKGLIGPPHWDSLYRARSLPPSLFFL